MRHLDTYLRYVATCPPLAEYGVNTCWLSAMALWIWNCRMFPRRVYLICEADLSGSDWWGNRKIQV